MSVGFENGALGVIHASRWATGHFNELRLRIYGDKGSVEVVHRHDGSSLRACLGENAETASWEDIQAAPVQTNYQRFAEAVRTGVMLEPSFRHATQLQKVLDLAAQTDRDHQDMPV